MKVRLTCTVNQEPVDVLADDYKTLLEVLREDLQLTGTKHGCELGECGACAVLLDGKPVLSCLVLAVESVGRQITTVEGLAADGRLHPLQECFADLGAAQCGYCTPGILITAKALLDAEPNPSRERICEALSGNLCRCTGYLQIVEAVEEAAKAPAMKPTRVIGRPRRRVDGRAKVTGQTRFADDIILPRMLHCRLLRSTQPHARIVTVDTSKAAQVDGVHLVLTGESFPIPYGILPVSHDEHALCRDKVRFVGDPVAAVIARDEATADLAVNLIDVTYEPLRTFAGPADSLAHDEPRIHDYGDHGNVHKAVSLQFGDVDAALAAADHRVRRCVLLRGEYAPADRTARVGGVEGSGRQARHLLQHPDPALPAPRAGEGARDPRRAYPCNRHA